MYCLESFAETSPEILRALIQRYPLATLVSVSANGLEVNHIPLYLAPGEGPQRKNQLALEYAPEPPFQAGRPEDAPKDIVEVVRCRTETLRAERERMIGQWITRPPAG
ncbi:FMN-binding negative transcriptional regulator [Acidithiobacillus sp.]|uniref:FMN-binding negative transcriptional regulator n=1 Tax=Acidithiobacillus sp. TaxID=1872118 RepID=UPI0025877037|nr:FMN-binding negative transcriptional regulator [Acidithiobacillus sp.]MDD5374081.1 FMN-binding negative transcriptional regulator [Acidithiobacillus sp.]